MTARMKRVAILLILAGVLSDSALAQPLDVKTATAEQLAGLDKPDDISQGVALVWTFGYVSGQTGKTQMPTVQEINELTERLVKEAQKNRQVKVIGLAARLLEDRPPAAPGPQALDVRTVTAQQIVQADENVKGLAIIWTSGYVSALAGRTQIPSGQDMETWAAQLGQESRSQPTARFLTLVKKVVAAR